MASLQSHLFDFFIRHMNIFGGDGYDPQAVRQRSEQAGFMAKPQAHVQMLPVEAGAVPAEWLVPQAAPETSALLYLHGGAWFLGSPKLYRRFVSGLAQASGVRALVIDYRLAPEHPFPAALEDCISAYEWLLGSGIPAHKIVVAGDSAGGNLTLALLVALRDRGRPLPAGAVAISPATDLAGTGESQRTRRHLDPFFYKMGTNRIVEDYITSHDACHPHISPLYADLRGLPPLLIHVGDHEILFDDAVRFGEKAAAAGVQVKLVVWPGMFHVFQLWGSLLPEARRANAQIAGFVRQRLEDD
jgi:acetyl esterase/lipase